MNPYKNQRHPEKVIFNPLKFRNYLHYLISFHIAFKSVYMCLLFLLCISEVTLVHCSQCLSP